jgi:hypothetical protein
VVTAFKALGFALSARAILLVALLGAFVLAVMAVNSQSIISLEILAVYGIFGVIPVAYLEARRRMQ